MPVYFPQMESGAYAQYPARKVLSFRTVMDEKEAGTALRASDEGAAKRLWLLTLRGLSDGEASAIQNLFAATNGPHGDFVFLDPEANLLRHSEELAGAVWEKSAGLNVAMSAGAPEGYEQSWTIGAGGIEGELWQTVGVPTEFSWAFSFLARAAVATTATAFVRCAHGEHAEPIALSAEWQRYSVCGRWFPAGVGITCGMRLGSGTQVEATGFQLDAQPRPAGYRASKQQSGLVSGARFDQERLRITTLAPNHHQTSLRIVAVEAGEAA